MPLVYSWCETKNCLAREKVLLQQRGLTFGLQCVSLYGTYTYVKGGVDHNIPLAYVVVDALIVWHAYNLCI